jgi:F-type H+-transporting ATPase subunit gamma
MIFYNYYINTIKQIAVEKISLPIDAEEIKKYLISILDDYTDLDRELNINTKINYKLEPTSTTLAIEIIPIILDMIFHGILLQSKASEHSSRMVAMK